jgi:hypothetical protein
MNLKKETHFQWYDGYNHNNGVESVVTSSSNSGHVVVPKTWIGKEAIVTLKGKENKTKGKR